MKVVTGKRCIIGEGPIWNAREKLLYFTNGLGNEFCTLDLKTEKVNVTPLDFNVSAIAFGQNGEPIVSCTHGVFYADRKGRRKPLYDADKYRLLDCNDMKVGPDGAIYVGTQSSERLGKSDAVDGKLYRIDSRGGVRLLLDGLMLSNGMDWSADGKLFYHTDSDTHTIKEYAFIGDGKITFTGRSVFVRGVDGFTMDRNDRIYAACWGQGHIAVIDTVTMQAVDFIPTASRIPASCCFCGEDMDTLAITTASYGADLSEDTYAGFTQLIKTNTMGRAPYIFGERK